MSKYTFNCKICIGVSDKNLVYISYIAVRVYGFCHMGLAVTVIFCFNRIRISVLKLFQLRSHIHIYICNYFTHLVVFTIIKMCVSTSRDRTHTTSRGFVLSSIHVEYCTIGMISPIDPELLSQRVFHHL